VIRTLCVFRRVLKSAIDSDQEVNAPV
jgi:hypothetical protein